MGALQRAYRLCGRCAASRQTTDTERHATYNERECATLDSGSEPGAHDIYQHHASRVANSKATMAGGTQAKGKGIDIGNNTEQEV